MKKLLLFAALFLCGLALVACSGQADTVTTADGLVLTPNADGTAYTVTDYIGTADTVTVPAVHSGLPVTAIGTGAFADTDLVAVDLPDSITAIGIRAFAKCKSLTAITLPDGVQTLGRSAFSGCTALAEVTLSASLAQIDSNTFRDCSALLSITIPDTVTEIGAYAFAYCDEMTVVRMGRGVTKIAKDAFYRCNDLAAVHITDLAAWCRIEFGSNPLTQAGALYLNGTLVTDLVIPDGIGCINDYAFAGCTALQSITLHDDLYKLGEHAFDGCSGIRSATVPASVLANLDSKNLRHLTVLDGSIPADAFRDCTALTTLVLGDKVEEVGDGAFWGCFNLRSVTVGSRVSYIGDFAFEGCVRLCEVINRSELTLIAGDFTDGGISRYAIEVHDRASKLTVEGEFVFYTTDRDCYLVDYVGAEDTVSLPARAQSYQIYNYAFAYRESLLSVDTGDSVTTVGTSAFEGCTNLAQVTIGAEVKLIKMSAFSACHNLSNAVFAVTDGWYTVYIISATEGDPMQVADPATNAQNLRETYLYAFLKRTFL